MKAVFHVSDPQRLAAALSAAENLYQFGTEVAVRIVVNGEAVHLPPQQLGRLARLTETGARVLVCAQALQRQNLQAGDLPGMVSVVPAGVVALVEAQQQGFAYIRP